MSEPGKGTEIILEDPHYLESNFPSHRKTLARSIVQNARHILGAKVPREERYSVSATPYQEMDETFQSNSVKDVLDWSDKHPTNRPAVGEFGGYGTATAGIVETVRKQGVNAYGLALAYERINELTTPLTTLIQGDMGEIAVKGNDSTTLALIKTQLEQAHCSLGFALLQCRPVIGYAEMEKQQSISNSDIPQFYHNMFKIITTHLLAPDGIFDLQIPLHIPDKKGFRENLQSSLGSNYILLPLQRSPYQRLWVQDYPTNPRFSLTTMRIIRSDLT